MTYEDIIGWFNSESFYDKMVERFPMGHFIELGSWLGKSTGYLGIKIKDKNIILDCIDNWKPKFYSDLGLDEGEMTPLEIFNSNMDKLGVKVNTIQSDVRDAVKLYKDNSIDFIMIDLVPEDYSLIKEVIDLWTPKVRGVLAGKDYIEKYPTVRKAVEESFTDFNVKDGIWWVSQ